MLSLCNFRSDLPQLLALWEEKREGGGRGGEEKERNLQPVVLSGHSLAIPFLSPLYGVTHVRNPNWGIGSHGRTAQTSVSAPLCPESRPRTPPRPRLQDRVTAPSTPKVTSLSPLRPLNTSRYPHTQTPWCHGQGQGTDALSSNSFVLFLCVL